MPDVRTLDRSGLAAGICRFAALFSLGVGTLVLLGWALDMTALKSLLPHLPAMRASTALAFVLAGAALQLLAIPAHTPSWTPATRRMRIPLGRAIAILVVAMALLALAEHWFGWNAAIDPLLSPDLAGSPDEPAPSRMSLDTAVSVLLIGSALAMLDVRTRRGRWPAQWLCLAVALIVFLALLGYLYGVRSLQSIGPYSSMALPTSVTLLVLCGGIVSARPTSGIFGVLSHDGAGSVMGRRLLPAAILIPPLLDWLRTAGQQAGWYNLQFGHVLLVFSLVIVFSVLIWRTILLLNRVDAQRRQAGEALHKGQLLLQTVVDHSPAVIYAKDLEGRYLLVNRRFTELFQRSVAASLGKTDHEMFPAAIADTYRALDQRVIAAGVAVTGEESAPRHDGVRTYLSVKCPLQDEAGQPYGIFGISTDITELKQTQLKMHLQLNQLRLLDQTTRAIGHRQDLQSIFQVVLRSLEDGLPIDFGCICLYDAALRLLSVDCIGALSQPCALEISLAEKDRIAIDENALSRCVSGELVYETDISRMQLPLFRQLARGGLKALVIAPLLMESKVFGVLIAARQAAESFGSGDCEFLRQLSEHVALAVNQTQLYGNLQLAYDDLRQTQQTVLVQERLRALGQMASGIAHDINNALSPISLYIESLLEHEKGVSARGRAQLNTIQQAVDDVASTIARMREFYRPREARLQLAAVDLNHLVQQMSDLTRARWRDIPQQHGFMIDLRMDLAPSLPAIMGAEAEIRDALTNLIFNAVDAMPQGGSLTLRTMLRHRRDEPSAQHVCVEITDSGIGMDEATRQRCLEPFFTTKGDRGSGLGLPMVYGMVQRHSAEFEIDSKVDAGTSARIIFPMAAASMQTVGPEETPSRPLRPLRVLLIDDDPVVIESLHSTLQQDGHDVVAANGGQAGIEIFMTAQHSGKPYCVVITDLGMPYIDGRKVAEAIYQASPTTPIILLTGWGHRLLEEKERFPYVSCVLSKPPKLQELRGTLKKLCRE